MASPEPNVSNLYYAEFAGATFVIQAEDEAVEDAKTASAVLQGIADLLRHGIRVVLVFGKGTGFEEELLAAFPARQHPETNRLVIPENALPRIRDERRAIAAAIVGLCQAAGIPHRLLPESVVRAERRIAHDSTGIVAGFDVQAVRAVLDEGRLAILGFGGEDDRRQFLHVPSVSLAADLAVELDAQKLLLLTHDGGIFTAHRKGGLQQLSFADLEELLCLLQRKDASGELILRGSILPTVHAAIRAVAGGVSQVHVVSYSRVLEEILTRTGVGTMIERQQSHHVDYARQDDLAEIERLHVEAQRYTTPHGTPYVKPLARPELARLLPQTLLLKHRGIVIGKLHATEIPGAPQTCLIGGLVVGENHQDSQHGQLLFSEALGRLRQRGYSGAAALTASERAKWLFERSGGVATAGGPWQGPLLAGALFRYHPDERDQVTLFEFRMA